MADGLLPEAPQGLGFVSPPFPRAGGLPAGGSPQTQRRSHHPPVDGGTTGGLNTAPLIRVPFRAGAGWSDFEGGTRKRRRRRKNEDDEEEESESSERSELSQQTMQ